MPHGAGFAGGGGAGGGYYGGGVYYGRGRRGRCTPRSCLIWMGITFGVSVIVTLSLVLSLATEPHQISDTEIYTLTDNRIVPYKGDFCQDLRAASTQEPNNRQASASLYFFNSRPPLTDRESFNVSESAQLDGAINYHSWNFYFNAGSNTTFQVCYQPDTMYRDVKYLLIRGTGNFNKWYDDVKDSHAIYSSRLTAECQRFSHRVTTDDMYYFVFYLNSHRKTTVNIDFQFDRTLYHIVPESIISNCSFPLDGYSSCALSAPMNSGYTALLSLAASPPVDYSDDGGEIHIGCQPRAWLYVVIALAVLIFVGVIGFCVVFAFVKFVIGMTKKSSSSPLTGTVSAKVTSSFVQPSTVAYSSLPDYGSVPNEAPPPYR